MPHPFISADLVEADVVLKPYPTTRGLIAVRKVVYLILAKPAQAIRLNLPRSLIKAATCTSH